MKLRKITFTRWHKAASAALALSLISTTGGAQTAVSRSTIPPLPDEEEALKEARHAFRWHHADTPLLLRNFLNLYPSSASAADARLMLGDWYFYNKEYPLALQWYSAIADNAFSGDTRERMLYHKAYSLIKTGYYKEARRLLLQLSGSKEYSSPTAFYLAYLDYVDGNYDKAYEAFKRIDRKSEKGEEAEFYINQIEFLRGNYQKVATTSERLLSVPVADELWAETMRVGGIANFKLGNKAMARNILKNYVDKTGDGAELSALYTLGTIYYDEGNYDAALPLFSVVTEYPGELAQSAWLYIGQISLAQGDAQAAALAFDQAARESWNSDVAETAAYNRAVTSSAGMSVPFSDAAQAMENFIDSYPSSPYASSLSGYLANAYYANRDYENALRLTEKINPPTQASREIRQKALYQLGVSRMQQGIPSQAVTYLKEASQEGNPDKEVAAQALLWLGDAYYAEKDYQNAAKAYSKAVDTGLLSHNKALAYYNLGYSYLKLHNYKQAEKAFKDALGQKDLNSQQTSDARLRYADCLYYNGNYQQALAEFRKLKAAGGNDGAYAAIREADILGKEGNITEKISILESLAKRDDAGFWHSTAISRLADAYSEKGDHQRAADLYGNLLDGNNGTDDPQVYYSLASNAENLLNSGNKEAAYAAYKRLEKSGISDLYAPALTGIMLSSPSDSEVEEYAELVASLPGISADEADEARLTGALASLRKGGASRDKALSTLRQLASSPERATGAQASVVVGEQLLKDGKTEEAETVLLNLTDNGSDSNYWMARGYIALTDVYIAQGKNYLAKLYLDNLRSNYPGKEKDITEMINSRLKKLNQ